MNRIDYDQAGGFPLSTQILAAAQKAYWILNQYAYFAGNNFVIITGCEPGAGGALTDGYVVINGEPMPFKGTTITESVIIVETPDARGFEDGNVKPVIYERYATFGSGGTEYEWVNFRRPKTLFELEDELNLVKQATPIGLIGVWDQPVEVPIPLGWVEHVEMAGRTPVHHLPGDVNFGALGANIGAAQVTIETGNLPPLSVNIPIAPNGDNPGDNMYGRAGVATNRSFTVKAGEATPMSNVQPSRIVKFIRFVGFN